MDRARLRFQGMNSGVQREKTPGTKVPGASAFGAPSAWLFLIRLHACRAGLCFTRRSNCSLRLPGEQRAGAIVGVAIDAGSVGGPARFLQFKENRLCMTVCTKP